MDLSGILHELMPHMTPLQIRLLTWLVIFVTVVGAVELALWGAAEVIGKWYDVLLKF